MKKLYNFFLGSAIVIIVVSFFIFLSKYLILIFSKLNEIKYLFKNNFFLLVQKIFMVLNRESMQLFNSVGTYLLGLAGILGILELDNYQKTYQAKLAEKRIKEIELQKEAMLDYGTLLNRTVKYINEIFIVPSLYMDKNYYPFKIPELPSDNKPDSNKWVRPPRLIKNKIGEFDEKFDSIFPRLSLDSKRKTKKLNDALFGVSNKIQGYIQGELTNKDAKKSYNPEELSNTINSLLQEAERIFTESYDNI